MATVKTFPPPSGQRLWRLKKKALIASLLELCARSPVLALLELDERDDAFRALLGFRIATLVEPVGDQVRTEGPVIGGLRYERAYLTRKPVSWELFSVLEPIGFFNPNAHPGGGLCLGDVGVAPGMVSLVSQIYAGLSIFSSSTREWEGMRPVAADFVRRHAAEFPLLETGLLERPPASVWRPLPGEPPLAPDSRPSGEDLEPPKEDR